MQTSKNITNDLINLNHVLSDLIKEAFAKNQHSLTRLQAHILLLLDSCGKLSMSEIANRLGISKPNTTPIINKLCQFGYVQRFINQDDRRVTLVGIADIGHRISSDINRVIHNYVDSRVQNLTQAESSELGDALKSCLKLLK